MFTVVDPLCSAKIGLPIIRFGSSPHTHTHTQMVLGGESIFAHVTPLGKKQQRLDRARAVAPWRWLKPSLSPAQPNTITACQWHDHGMELPKIPLPPPPCNLRYYPNILLEGLRETTEYFRLASVSRNWPGHLPLCMMLRWDGWGIRCSIRFAWGGITHIQNFDSEASRKKKLRPCLNRKMVLKMDLWE